MLRVAISLMQKNVVYFIIFTATLAVFNSNWFSNSIISNLISLILVFSSAYFFTQRSIILGLPFKALAFDGLPMFALRNLIIFSLAVGVAMVILFLSSYFFWNIALARYRILAVIPLALSYATVMASIGGWPAASLGSSEPGISRPADFFVIVQCSVRAAKFFLALYLPYVLLFAYHDILMQAGVDLKTSMMRDVEMVVSTVVFTFGQVLGYTYIAVVVAKRSLPCC